MERLTSYAMRFIRSLGSASEPEPLFRQSRMSVALPQVSEITAVEESNLLALYLPAVPPADIYREVEEAAAKGIMARIAGRLVDIRCNDPVLVVAFVWCAKPWLRALSVNGVRVF